MIEKFEKRINNIKEKVDKRKIYVATFLLFGIILIFAMDMTNNFKRQKQERENEYNKSMYEAVGYVKNVEAELEKITLINTRKLTTTTLASIWSKSSLAKDSLSALPIEQNAMSATSKFLTQLGDYAYYLMKNTVSDKKLTDEEYTNLESLYSSIKNLSTTMSQIYENLNSGRIKWDELKKLGNEKLKEVDVSSIVANIESIEKTSQEYQGLIYDGAFSDHIMELSPKYIENEQECNEEDAISYINNIFGEENIESINSKGSVIGRVELYAFDVTLKENNLITNVYITKKGCKLYLMVSDRKVEKENIVPNQAIKLARDFLKNLGFDNLKDTYYQKTENMLTINFAAMQDDIVLYPDLIKVKVALDNGQICSVESQGYIFNHKERENIDTLNSIEKAQEILNDNIEVLSKSLAIIPTDSKDEVLVYEFKGVIKEREYLVYVNANTLEEERVLVILETPGGTLTM